MYVIRARDPPQARPEVAWVFFSLYVAMVFLVIMNMFIGIITKFFDVVSLHTRRARAVPVAQQRDSGGDSTQVHEELQHADAWKACAMAALSLTFDWC